MELRVFYYLPVKTAQYYLKQNTMIKAPFSVRSIISSIKQNKIKNFGHVKKEGNVFQNQKKK